MTQPLDRTVSLPVLGALDEEKRELWAASPFLLPQSGKNLSAHERNCLYLNLDGNDFIDVSFPSMTDIDSDSRSVIAADFNRDGAPDLLVASVGGGPLRLFLNRYPQRNRVQIELIGTKSNRLAIGSRVIAECGDQKFYRDVFTENGFMGQGPAELSLGIGSATSIDRLTVRWPSGQVKQFSNIPAGSSIAITEDASDFVVK
ncbi:MAG: CRTAC1 family protein [Pirellulaceae bacterium]|nr:CRTAC1 family protein [Pirellulaceae bacterium]